MNSCKTPCMKKLEFIYLVPQQNTCINSVSCLTEKSEQAKKPDHNHIISAE